MVRAGLLRHRVTIQEKQTTDDEWGQPIETWVDLATVWGEIRDLNGREFIESRMAPGGEITVRVVIRYRDDVNRIMRVLHGSRVLQVITVADPTGRREELRLECQEES